MEIERYRKAIAAFCVSFIASALCTLLFFGLSAWPEALKVAAITATLTELAVQLIANRQHGYNVHDIAEALVDAAYEDSAEAQDAKPES